MRKAGDMIQETLTTKLEELSQKHLGKSLQEVKPEDYEGGSSCSCVLDSDCYGGNGWHFVRARKNFCWTTNRMQSTGQPYVHEIEADLAPENTEGSFERILECAGHCTRRREVDDVCFEREEPNCNYAGKVFAYERCTHYVAAIEGDFVVDEDDSTKIVSIEEFRKRRQKNEDQ